MEAASEAKRAGRSATALGRGRSSRSIRVVTRNSRRSGNVREGLWSIKHDRPERVRFRLRSAGERSNGRLKDEGGGRQVTGRGQATGARPLRCGSLGLKGDQLMRLATAPEVSVRPPPTQITSGGRRPEGRKGKGCACGANVPPVFSSSRMRTPARSLAACRKPVLTPETPG